MNQAMELWELAHTDDRFHFTFYIFSSNYGISRITFIKRWLRDQNVLRRPSLQRSFSRSRLRGFFLFILCMLVQKLLILELEVWRRKGVSAHVSRCDCPLSPLRRPLDRLKGSETGPTHKRRRSKPRLHSPSGLLGQRTSIMRVAYVSWQF